MIEIAIFALIIGIASYFHGITGFGQGLIAAPLAFVLFDKATALTILVVIALIINLYLSVGVKERLDRKIFLPIAIGSLIGLPLGVVVAQISSLAALQLGAGVVAIISAGLLLFYRFKLSKRKRYGLLAGLLAGFMQTTTTLSGPPVVLILTAQETPKNIMRKLLPTYFLALFILTFPLFLVAGLLSSKGMLYGIIAAPLVLLSAYLGSKQGDNIGQGHYRLLTLGAVFASGTFAVYHGLVKNL